MGEALQELLKDDIAKERAEGKVEGKADVAEAMLSDGEPTDKIIKYTGVTIETLQEIAKRLGLTITITTETGEEENKSE